MLGISPTTLGRWAIAGRIANEITDGRRTFRRSELLKGSASRRQDEEEETQ